MNTTALRDQFKPIGENLVVNSNDLLQTNNIKWNAPKNVCEDDSSESNDPTK